MGSWGAGLYSDDYAMDLRATVAAAAKLPLGDDEVLDLIRTTELCADDPQDTDHTTFWLVTADQLAQRGCYPEEARRRALEIIASGANLKTLSELDAPAAMLRKRKALLEELGRRLIHPAPRVRKTMSAPQAFTFELGEVFAFPTSNGRALNPYFKSRAQNWKWSHDGWRVAVVVEVGREFGYLAWCRLMTARKVWREKPTLAQAWRAGEWILRGPGTCSPIRRQRLEADSLGYVEVDGAELDRRRQHLAGGAFRSVRSAALGDICVSNDLDRPYQRDWMPWNRPPHVVPRLATLTRPIRPG